MPEYCVTGGNGFIAAHLIKSLLQKGHTVRTTARDPENIEKIGFLLELNGAKERLKIMRADLLEEGSFDTAVEGADGVFHVASPVIVAYEDNIKENLIDPAIKGTLNVLNSCKKASSVKRVVLTSSCSAIRYRFDAKEASPLNESHWSDPEYCKTYNLWYGYAKTIAEKEAWNFAEEKGIDLVVVNPSFVVGPLLSPQPTSTLLVILAVVKAGLPSSNHAYHVLIIGISNGLRGEYPNMRLGFVHVDDVVNAHILAMEEIEASGRFICSASVAHWSEIIPMLRHKYPTYPYENKCCSTQKGDDNPHSMDNSKIIKLGLPPLKTLDQMFDDCITSFQEKGFL